MKLASEERIDRLFQYGYGLLRIGKIALVKRYKNKFRLPVIYIEKKSKKVDIKCQ
ncbi:hypothetical protein [Tissierella sp.]|uniref:hypothetical protein n=1 Tax=Tissierella sp. TaxID=41274 RepID=UPI00285449B8|nr:hypothetical protein [Tissierella sp.]MDR7856083.1 hypothetical protein [Tissierella sp.]